MKKKKAKRPWGVFLSIILGIAFGSIVGEKGQVFGITFYSIVDVLGSLFLNALTLVVVPLVSSSIIVGISRIGGGRQSSGPTRQCRARFVWAAGQGTDQGRRRSAGFVT